MSGDFPLAMMYAHSRTLRLADGPDEVHQVAVAKLELAKHTTIPRSSKHTALDEMLVTRG